MARYDMLTNVTVQVYSSTTFNLTSNNSLEVDMVRCTYSGGCFDADVRFDREHVIIVREELLVAKVQWIAVSRTDHADVFVTFSYTKKSTNSSRTCWCIKLGCAETSVVFISV